MGLRLGTRLGLDHGSKAGEVIPPPPIGNNFVPIDDIKLWALFESGTITGYSRKQKYGIGMSLEL